MEQIVFGIRADGNKQIGMGHLMRTLSIALELKKENVQVIYITKEPQSKEFAEEKGFSCLLLPGNYEVMEDETEETLAYIDRYDIRLLLVDSYGATKDYLSCINDRVPVFYLDDLGRMGLPVSGLINYNIYGQDMGYEAQYPAGTVLMLGSKYAPVKTEFSQVPYEVRKEADRIMITMGGSDSLNIAGQLARKLLASVDRRVQITLISGRFSPHLEALQRLAGEDDRLRVLTDVHDMWNVMADSDIAISAAGSTMYELCTVGVPTVCCYYVENQRRIAEGFGSGMSMCNAGDFSKEPDKVLQRMVEETWCLLKNYEKRRRLSDEMRAVSYGKGTKRIVEKLIDYSE